MVKKKKLRLDASAQDGQEKRGNQTKIAEASIIAVHEFLQSLPVIEAHCI